MIGSEIFDRVKDTIIFKLICFNMGNNGDTLSAFTTKKWHQCCMD